MRRYRENNKNKKIPKVPFFLYGSTAIWTLVAFSAS
jgi:hypothetical protein